jgi:hypothetical protein
MTGSEEKWNEQTDDFVFFFKIALGKREQIKFEGCIV